MKSGVSRRTDVPGLILALRKAGWSNARIGREIGVHENTVGNWERGVEPLLHAGEALKALHARICLTATHAP